MAHGVKYLRHPLVKILLVLPISGLLLYLAFRDVELGSFIASFREARVAWILLAIIISILSYGVRALRWQQLLNVENETTKVSVFEAVYGLLFGYFLNLLIPRAGEVGRCTLLANRIQYPLERAIGTVVTERIIDLICSALITLLAVVVSVDRFGGFLWQSILQPFLVSLSLGKILAIGGAALFILLLIFFAFYLLRTGRLGGALLSWWQGKKEGLVGGLRSVLLLRSKSLFVFYTLLLWICYWLMAYTILLALPATMHLDMKVALTVLVVGTFGMIIPAQGGIGSFHLVVVLWLGVEEIGRADALAYATLSHEGQVLLYMFLLALCYLATSVCRHKKHRVYDKGKE